MFMIFFSVTPTRIDKLVTNFFSFENKVAFRMKKIKYFVGGNDKILTICYKVYLLEWGRTEQKKV